MGRQARRQMSATRLSTVSVATVGVVGIDWHAARENIVASASSVVDLGRMKVLDLIFKRLLDVTALGLPREERGKLKQEAKDRQSGHSVSGRLRFQT